jgi:hypothetical protein
MIILDDASPGDIVTIDNISYIVVREFRQYQMPSACESRPLCDLTCGDIYYFPRDTEIN